VRDATTGSGLRQDRGCVYGKVRRKSTSFVLNTPTKRRISLSFPLEFDNEEKLRVMMMTHVRTESSKGTLVISHHRFLLLLIVLVTLNQHYVMGTGTSFQSYYPPVCRPQGERCYRTTNSETQNRFNDCCTMSGTGAIYMSCDGGPWSSVCTVCPNNDCSNRLPTFDPKGVKSVDHSVVTVGNTGGSSLKNNCTAIKNLGPETSSSTGYAIPFPPMGQNDIFQPAGRETEIALLVGGNYIAPRAAEIEGNTVVLGDFLIGAAGTNSLGTLITTGERRCIYIQVVSQSCFSCCCCLLLFSLAS